MTVEIDARGLACPAPVIKTKDAIDGGAGSVSVLVDNDASRENVTRFLENQGFETSVQEVVGAFAVNGQRAGGGVQEAPAPRAETTSAQKIMIMAATDRMGFGDDELGTKLMASFLATINEMGKDLWRMVLVNNGVKLAIEGSPALEGLQELEKSGVSILVCGTCLTHFGLLEQKRVGETTNMLDVVTSMHVADKVINI